MARSTPTQTRGQPGFTVASLILFFLPLVSATRVFPQPTLSTRPATGLQPESSPTTTLFPFHHPILDLRADTKSVSISTSATVRPLNGYTYVGCYRDESSNRILAARRVDDVAMTPELCRDICGAGGFGAFGVENGKECYCDVTVATFAMSTTGCVQRCAGDPYVVCGAWSKLNVYSATEPWTLAGGISTGVTGSPRPTSPVEGNSGSDSGSGSGSVSGSSSSSSPASGAPNMGLTPGAIAGIAVGSAVFAVLFAF